MSLVDYFRKEMELLQTNREVFISQYPHLVKFLSSENPDPDVERLIENFALLTSMVRRELDAGFPYVAESIMKLMWPNYMSSIPSCAIQDFRPKSGALVNKHFVPRGTNVDSLEVDKIKCIFKTCYDISIYPIDISSVSTLLAEGICTLQISFSTMDDLDISDIDIDDLKIFLGVDVYRATMNYMWLLNHLEKITIVEEDNNGLVHNIPNEYLKPIGFDDEERLLYSANNEMEGLRIIKEFFAFPDKFNFVKIKGLGILKTFKGSRFSLRFSFTKNLPPLAYLKKEDISIHATPIINIFETACEPITNDYSKDEHRIAVDRRRPDSFEIIRVLNVQGSKGRGGRLKLRNYGSFERFGHVNDLVSDSFYNISMRRNAEGDLHHYISFSVNDIEKQIQDDENEVISIDAICCNKSLPERLMVGDINGASKNEAAILETYNLTKPTELISVNIDDSMIWTLVSNLSLNYTSLLNKEAFYSILQTYNFKASYNIYSKKWSERLFDAIIDIKPRVDYRIMSGVPLRGVVCHIVLDESIFSGIGELYRFGSVLANFLDMFVNVNSFCELEIMCDKSKELISWSPKQGIKSVI